MPISRRRCSTRRSTTRRSPRKDGLIGHGGVVVFDDTVDMAHQARFAMEFCAAESCGKCTPCRIGSVRGMETMDKIIAGRGRGQSGTDPRPLPHHEVRFPLRTGRLHSVPGDERDGTTFPEDFRRGAATGRRIKKEAPDVPDPGTRLRHAGRHQPQTMVTLTVDGHAVTVPEGTSIMRASMEAGIKVPKLCATDTLDSFGSCRMCLVEIEGRAGTPASCTTPVAPGMKVRTVTDKLRKLRRGVMELYISDHPLDCLTCSANGNCELQDTAGEVGLREVRYGYEGDNHLSARGRTAPTRISSSIRRNASSARAACAPARKCRAHSR